MSATDATLGLLVDAIADQVAAKVRTELISHFETASRIQPLLLNVKDAAIYLGRSEQAVQHLIFQNQFPVIRSGRRVHLDRRDLDKWIEKYKN